MIEFNSPFPISMGLPEAVLAAGPNGLELQEDVDKDPQNGGSGACRYDEEDPANTGLQVPEVLARRAG